MFELKKSMMLGVALMTCLGVGILPVRGAMAAELTCTVPKPAGSVITVSNAAALKAAVSKLVSGQTIQLNPGNYGDLSFLSGKKFSAPVLITSANKNNMAIVTSTKISNSQNINLSYLKFFADGSGKTPSWGSVVPPNDSYDGLPRQPGKTALYLENSRDVTVAHSLFSGHNRGTMFSNSTNVKILNNVFTNTTMDHMAFTGMNNLLVEGNYTGGFKAFWASHNDSIQFWNTGTGSAGNTSSYVTIRNNILTSTEQSGSKGGVQGVFIFSEKVARQGGGYSDFYKNVVIENNTIVTSHPNAITLSATAGLRIRNNTALVDCANHKKGWEPRLTVYNGSTGVTISGNRANRLHAATGNPTVQASFPGSWVVTGNTVTTQCMTAPRNLVAPGCRK